MKHRALKKFYFRHKNYELNYKVTSRSKHSVTIFIFDFSVFSLLQYNQKYSISMDCLLLTIAKFCKKKLQKIIQININLAALIPGLKELKKNLLIKIFDAYDFVLRIWKANSLLSKSGIENRIICSFTGNFYNANFYISLSCARNHLSGISLLLANK